MTKIRAVLGIVVLTSIVGCGSSQRAVDSGTTGDDAVAGDDDAASGADAGPSCGVTWAHQYRGGSAVVSIDPAPVHTGRTTRVEVTSELARCEAPAMPRLTINPDNLTATIEVGVFVRRGGTCDQPAQTLHRPIALRLERVGTWRIKTGEAILDVEVDGAPERACGAPGACLLDCDCTTAGEVCLGGTNIAGDPFLACARPCELDRDCGGTGTCQITVADDLAAVCRSGPECDGDANVPCPDGYACRDDVCEPTFTLSSQTRHDCDCDADCDAPLRCVEPMAAGRGRRCELACPTAGPWCQGAHACGLATDDLAGTAASDSVCGWLGD